MKITSIETIPVIVPIDQTKAIVGGGGAHLESPFLLLRVHTDEGLIGLGEVSGTMGWSGEDQVTAAHIVHSYIEPVLIGRNPLDIRRHAAAMRGVVTGHAFTRAGIEIALWDLLGKAAGLPVYQLLGGRVRDEIPTVFPITGKEPALAAEIALWAVEQGFGTVKVKVGLDPDEDVERVRAVRTAVGDGVKVAADANGGWTTRAAIQTIPRLEDLGIVYMEQPVRPLDVQRLAEVRAQVSVPIVADESVFSPEDAMAVVRAGAADVLSAYVGKAGGITGAATIATIAEASGLGCTVGNNLELGIGDAA
ncbi:MAG: mandelate racemase/muconate lactonizing enzyme family protein, partial [Actinomycetota bacterium]